MTSISVRLSKPLATRIEKESRERGLSKSDIVRECIEKALGQPGKGSIDDIADLIGKVDDDDLPTDLSRRKKHYLKEWGFGQKRHR